MYTSLRTLIKFLLMGSIMISCQTDKLAKLPDFSIMKADSSVINVPHHVKRTTSVIIHFDADCKACQDEAQVIVDHLDELGNMKIVFVSEQELDKIDLFERHFKLSQHPNIIVGQDKLGTVPNHFGTHATPLTALYEGKRLRAVFEGTIDMDRLKATLKEIRS